MRPLPLMHLGPDDRALFVSDIHLSAADPALAQTFCDWLFEAVQGRQWLFLLGDIFDAWVGDDLLDDEPAQQALVGPSLHPLLAGLRRAQQQGTAIHLVHGNRDFLMGPRLAEAMGASLLSDPFVLIHPALGRALVCHGDQLCTDDQAYQAIREQVRQPAWQSDFLAQSLAQRLQTAARLRQESEQYKAGLEMALMDVNEAAADTWLNDAEAGLLIHGHTHRPGQYVLPSGRSRWVLPDWHTHQKGVLGGGLLLDSEGLRLVSI